MRKAGWMLFALIAVFALVGAAPFGAGVFLVAFAFALSLIPTWHGALLPGALSLLGLLAALAFTPVHGLRPRPDAGYLAALLVVLLAFSLSFLRGLRYRRASGSPG